MTPYCLKKISMMDSRLYDQQEINQLEQQAIALRNQADAMLQMVNFLKSKHLTPAKEQKTNVRAAILNRTIKSYHHKKLKNVK